MTAFTKEGIRKALAATWSTLTGIPSMVLDVAALVDPGALKFLIWNDTSNHIEFYSPTAPDISYDHTISGLVATNVKTAIDELKASIGVGSVYRGYVGSDGTTGNRLPVGWSALRTGAGAYEVTHNLGLANLTFLAVGLSCVGTAGNKTAQQRSSGTGNKFVIEAVDSGTGALTDEAFSFVAAQT
jgi:hypothetical protein